MYPKCFQWDVQIPLSWNISWEFVSISLQFIILKLGPRDFISGKENDLCKAGGVNRRLKLFSLWSSTHSFVLEMSCTVLVSPLGRSYFWIFYGTKLLFLCPSSLPHTGEGHLGICSGDPSCFGGCRWGFGDSRQDLFQVCLSSSLKPSTLLQVSGVRAAGCRKGQEINSSEMDHGPHPTLLESPVQLIKSCGQWQCKAGWQLGEANDQSNRVSQVETGGFWQSCERLKKVRAVRVQITPLVQSYWWLTAVNKQKKHL